MKRTIAATVFAALLASAHAEQPSQPSPGAQVAPGTWDVDRVRCSDLLAASDEDRASAAMFYYGYLAAKAEIHVIDVGRISDNVGRVMEECAETPTMTVPEAFLRALASKS